MSSMAEKLSKIGGHGCGCPEEGHMDSCCFSGRHQFRKPSFSSAARNHAYLGSPPPFRTLREANVIEERIPVQERILDVLRNFPIARGIVDFTKQNLAHTYTPVVNFDQKALPTWDDADFKEMSENLLCWHRLYLEKSTHITASEKLNFTKTVQLVTEQLETFGEVIPLAIQKTAKKDMDRRDFTTAIMFVSPMRVDTPWEKKYGLDGKPRRIFEGFELDGHGKENAAWVYEHPVTSDCFMGQNKPTRIPMYGEGRHSHRQVLQHFFECIEDGQVRGVSPFAATVEILELWRQVQRDIALRVQRQTKTNAVIQTVGDDDDEINRPNIGPNTVDADSLEWLIDPELQGYAAAQYDANGEKRGSFSPSFKRMAERSAYHKGNKTSERLEESGVFDIWLTENEKYIQQAIDNGSVAASELFQSLADSVAAGHGYSTNQVLRNYTDGNYTGQRSGRIDTVRTLERKKCITDAYATWVWKLIGEECIANGLLSLPKGVIEREGLNTLAKQHRYAVDNLNSIFCHGWAMPAPKIIEMKKDMEGFEAAKELGAISQSEIVSETRGVDLDTANALDLEDDKKMIDKEVARLVYRKEAFAKAGISDGGDEVGGDETQKLKTRLDAIGVAVRAGQITPQVADEEKARAELDLPIMSEAVRQCWKDGGEVRLPITLKSKEQNDLEREVIEEKVDEPETEETTEE